MEKTCLDSLRRQRKWPAEMAVNRNLAPNQLLLGVILANPRASGKAPSRRTGDADFEVKGVSESHSVAESVLPAFAHVRKEGVNHLRCGICRIEKEEARKTDVMHPLKVLLYAVFRNIPVHPMPQNHRPAFVRWVQEPGVKFRALLPAAARKQRQNSCDTEEDPFHALNIRILRLSLSLLLVWLKNEFFFYLTGLIFNYK